MAGSLATLDQPGGGALRQSLFIAGLIVTALLMVVIARLTTRTLHSELDQPPQQHIPEEIK